MSDTDEDEVQLDEARAFLATLPDDPAAYTEADRWRIEELLLSDNHGVVHVTAQLVREATARDAEAMAPLVQPLIDAVVHTDGLRRPELVAAIAEFDRTRVAAADPQFDRTPVARADPVGQYHRTLADTENEELVRSKRAAALAAIYDLFPQEVRDTVPTLLDCLEPAEDDVGLLCEAAGKALGTIAGKDDQVRARVIERFERELDRGSLPNKGVVYGVGNLVTCRSDAGLTLVEPLVEATNRAGVDSAAHEAERWHVVSALETIAEERPALLDHHTDRLTLLLTDDETMVRKQAIGLFETLGETEPAVLDRVADDLVAAADDPDPKIRRAVVSALAPLESRLAEAAEPAARAHLAALESAADFRKSTVLGELGRLAEHCPDLVVGGLVEIVAHLDHQSWGVRSSAASALGRLGSERPDAVRPLVERDASGLIASTGSTPLLGLLDDEQDSVRADAVHALGRIGAADRELADVVFPAVLGAVDDGDSHVEQRALRAFGRIGAAHPDAVTDDHVSTLVTSVGHVSETVRAAAAEAIGALAASGLDLRVARDPLVDLLDDYYPRPRVEACESLAALGAEPAAARIAPLRTHYDDDVREAAQAALAALDYDPDGSPESDSKSSADAGSGSERPAGARSEATGRRVRDDRSETTSEAASTAIPTGQPTQAPSLSLDYGDVETGRVVGRGGNAVVREGTVEIDGESRTVAVKEPVTEGTQTADDIAAFEREARQWDRLSDRAHVVGVVDWDVDPLPWIALEYMDGGSLAARVGECDYRQTLWICERVANAVRHDQTGMAHLDLKPANILFESTPDGVWDVPKVADWGIARLLNEHGATAGGMTATYAAPEQFDPDTYGTPDSRTDIYQLGVVLYELLVGEPPFTGSDVDVMQSVLSDEPALPGERVDGLPDGIDDTVETALATDPERRFETIERMQSRLGAHLDEL
ncbi:protein kinase domain-containing protein [Halomicrobium mukohataei]|uniref:Serine/threonine protein kinase n=2 Tax=Halomicrobium mukohataei TaxID=57705 RepID=C7P4Y9_HALMD|nr:protein kinase [Halomicrobium mukohataei]ACV49384.1 serine/threonine protein kinase [Halomicrobium mukohataei DSM 12286]QCD67212.1 serine/threonine protein kinase [Halomicrobium mukohataei]